MAWKLLTVHPDAISILGTGDALIQGGGAQNAKDKVVQHNGRGTVTIKDYTVINAGKLYRSCGDCTNNGGPRKVVVQNVQVSGMTSDLVGINSNYGDAATVEGSCGGSKRVCQEYKVSLYLVGRVWRRLLTGDGRV